MFYITYAKLNVFEKPCAIHVEAPTTKMNESIKIDLPENLAFE